MMRKVAYAYYQTFLFLRAIQYIERICMQTPPTRSKVDSLGMRERFGAEGVSGVRVHACTKLPHKVSTQY
jgi:hypothetical protein